MANSCVFRPKKDNLNSPELYDEIKGSLNKAFLDTSNGNKLAYDMAWDIYGLALSDEFRSINKDILKYREDGFPTYESLLKTEMVKTLLGDVNNKILSQKFKIRDNTRDNFKVALEDCLEFNKQHASKTAHVESINGKLSIVVDNKSEAAMDIFQKQYAAVKMADYIVQSILKPLGIEIGTIEGEEALYRNGKIDFNQAANILEGTKTFIMASDSMEGTMAIPEEFSHLIIGLKNNNPVVKRLLDLLTNNQDAVSAVLGDEYYDNLEAQQGDLNKLAEEALGKLLQRHLIDNKIQETLESNTTDATIISSIKNLFNRIKSFLKRALKDVKPSDIDSIINEANNAMSELAQQINKGIIDINKNVIVNSKRDAVFNSLVDQVSRDKEILEQALGVEYKRHKILRYSGESNVNAIEAIIKKLESKEAPDAESLKILYDYIHYATKTLNDKNNSLAIIPQINNVRQKFSIIQSVRTTLDSFAPILKSMYQEYQENTGDADGNSWDKEIDVVDELGNTQTVRLFNVLQQFNTAQSMLEAAYIKTALPSFIEFIKPYLGNVENIEELIKKGLGDTSLWDRWLTTMSGSSDQLLQAFDMVQRKQNDKARMKSLKDIRKIQAWQIECEKAGITDFEWMFEHYDNGHKTGNYVTEINYAQYYSDLRAFNKHLDEVYGKNPKDRTPKVEAKKAWLKQHATITLSGEYIPKSTIYHSKEWDRLTTKQKEMLEAYKKIKAKLDENYPPNRVSGRAIQMRRDGVQRNIDLLKNPSQILDNVKETWNSLSDRSEDDVIFGTRALQGFNGKQFNFLPVLYNNRLQNPDEISTDVGRALIAYAISANQYEATTETLNALETGRYIITSGIRETTATEVGLPVEERYSVDGKRIVNRVLINPENTIAKLNDWFESAVYQKYYAREGDFVLPLLGKRVSGQKITHLATSCAATCQLAFNWLANSANVATGIAMTNIEVSAGRYFNYKELASADAEYIEMLPAFVAELNSKTINSKLGLFCELFNVKYNYDNRGHQSQVPSVLKRLFGKNVAFLGQEGGDHWLYTRISIAMAKHTKIKVPTAKGYEIKSVWDALQIGNDENGLKEMKLPEGCLNLDNSAFDVGLFSRQMGEIHKKLFGVYNMEDRVAAQRYIAGQLMLMYRQWIVPSLNTRFEGKQYNQTLKAWQEGYYRTMLRICGELATGKLNIITEWDTLEDFEKDNLKKGLTELAQCFAVWAVANMLEWPDDKDRGWWMKYLEYMAKREQRELGNLCPSLIQLREMKATLESPTAVLGVISPMIDFTSALIDPIFFWDENDWNDELQSGRFEGHSTLYKRTMKLPIPILQWYNQIDLFANDIDDKINYYARTQGLR